MDKRALENLKELPVPPAREGARAAAIEAALDAFDSNAEKVSTGPKEAGAALRPTHASMNRRSLMRALATPHNFALAASLAALVIAAPFAFRELRGSLEMPPDIASTPQKEAAPLAKPGQAIARLEPAEPESGRRAKVERGAEDDEKTANEPALERQVATTESKVADGRADMPPPSPAPTAGGYAAGRPYAPGLGAIGQMQPAAPQDALGVSGGYVGDQMANLEREHRDKFETKDDNPVKQVAAEPVSTFSIDVDTASYSFVRRALNEGHLPQKAAVRVEEMINYFPYAYPAPETIETPFKPTVTVVPSPWNAGNKLVHVAIKGYDLERSERPKANLVFLLDVSGSMEGEDRLPLVKNAFRLLLDQLQPDDTVGIVTYASGSGVALEPTKVSDKGKILRALDSLGAGGSTAGAAGIADAYSLAESNFDKGAINRVILATDGDFNVGITDQEELKSFIERKRDSGIFLSILGVGVGNHNDALMQTLAQNGNGTAAYVDTLNEARKVLVDESSSALFPIAKDVKVQIEWNPAAVAEYRLVGYETRALKREDFNNDKVDAGDIGSGHTVTAIYEITPVGAKPHVDDLRYQPSKDAAAAAQPRADAPAGELGYLKLRYKRPDEQQSKLVELPILDSEAKPALDAAPTDVRFAIAVAGFGQLLRGEPFTGGYGYDDVLSLAQASRGDDPFGYRAEFLNLVRLAKSARP